MFSSTLAICECLSLFYSLLGCWQLGESASYYMKTDSDIKLISKEVANVSPAISFLYNGKGTILHCNDKTTLFEWAILSDSTISVQTQEDKDIRIFKISKDCNSLTISECTNNILTRYVLKSSTFKIEELSSHIEKISKQQYELLKSKNPFPSLTFFVARGRKFNDVLEIGGQEYLAIINGLPMSQAVVFIKSSMVQKSIPCYLITYDEQGEILYAQYVLNIPLND